MASIIRLRPEHKKYHICESPLLEGAEELEPAEIERRVQTHIDDPTPETRDAAIMAFRSIIRHITGRYIGTFRSIKSMEDDLISVAFEVVMAAVDSLQPADDICRVVSNRIISEQTDYINLYRSAASPSSRTQRRRYKAGKDIQLAVPLTDEYEYAEDDSSLTQFEVYQTLLDMDLTPLERQLLDPESWGKKPELLAEELKVSRATVFRALSHLQQLAKEVLYAD